MSRWMLVCLVFAAGCHARFKKHVDAIDAVRLQTVLTTGPSVSLGRVQGDGLAAAVANVAQEVRSMKAAEQLARDVNINKVNAAFTAGVIEAIGSGPPFATTEDPKAALFYAEVTDYGLYSPAIGVPGTFQYSVRVEIFLPNGKKVYNSGATCAVGFGDASELSRVLGTVDNVMQLKDMTRREVTATFEAASRMCAQQVVSQMRRHASH